MKSNIKDVARRAGVSTATVSHVINGTKPVSEEITKKVLKAIKGLNYTTNMYARSLRKQQSEGVRILLCPSRPFTFDYLSFMQKLTIMLQQNDFNYTVDFKSPDQEFRISEQLEGVQFLILLADKLSEQKLSDVKTNPAIWVCPQSGIIPPDENNPHILDLTSYSNAALYEKIIDSSTNSMQVLLSYKQADYFKKKSLEDSTLRKLLPTFQILSSEISSGYYATQDFIQSGLSSLLVEDHRLSLGVIKYFLKHEEAMMQTSNITIVNSFKPIETFNLPLTVHQVPYNGAINQIETILKASI